MLKKQLGIIGVLLVALVCVGCSGKGKVTGKVTLSDGTAATEGEITFNSVKNMGKSQIGRDGSFSMGEFRDGDGLPAATYKVSIAGVPGADKKYALPETSGFTVEVPKGGLKHDFKLDKATEEEE